MKVDAIKLVVAAGMSGVEPSDKELGDALGEAVDLALGFVGDVRRIADHVTAGDELAYLRHFHAEADFGPADGDVRAIIDDAYRAKTGRELPPAYRDEE